MNAGISIDAMCRRFRRYLTNALRSEGEALYLAAFACFAVAMFLSRTNFESLLLVSSESVQDVLQALALALLLARTVLCLSATLAQWLLSAALVMLGFVTWRITKEGWLFWTLLFVVCGKDIEVRKLARLTLLIVAPAFLVVVLLALLGVVESSTIVKDDGSLRLSMGFGHPNFFGLILFELCLAFCVVRFGKKPGPELIAIIVSVALCLVVSYSRTSAIALVILAILDLIFYFTSSEKARSAVRLGLLITVFLAVAMSLVLMVAYDPSNDLMVLINSVLSKRISLMNSYYLDAPLTILGRDYTNGTVIYNSASDTYSTFLVDNAYGHLVLRFGLLTAVVLLGAIFAFYVVAIHSHQWDSALMGLSVFLLFGVTESMALKFSDNYLLISLAYLLYGNAKNGDTRWSVPSAVDSVWQRCVSQVSSKSNASASPKNAFGKASTNNFADQAPRTYLTHEEVQQEALDLLLRFDAFCKEHNLHYSLDYGTLLGAVRHKGFIPWDDDIDLSMSRPELERLLSVADELPEDMKILTLDNSNLWYAFPKVATTKIRSQESVYEGVLEEYLWLDIFPMDGVPSDDEGLAREWAWGKGVHRYLQRRVRPNSGVWWKRAIKHVMAFVSRKRDVRAETSNKLKETLTVERYESSERVASLLCLQQQPWSLDKEAYERTELMEFEGHMLPVMSCWHEQLSSAYPGNYMQLPPEDQRKTHGALVWRVD